jgi:hypothetical protein
MIVLPLLFLALAPALMYAATPAKPPALDCETGPLSRTYGKTPWLVYSCNDLKSIAIIAAPGSPAAPFYYLWVYDRSGKYSLVGEGTGSATYTSAAYAQLRLLQPSDVEAMVAETRGTSSTYLVK